MIIDQTQVTIDVAGLGIICYSPLLATHIPDGSDYFTSHYTSEEQVQSHIQQGTIVGFSTCSPGKFILKLYSGYPDDKLLQQYQYKLRLGLKCVGGLICFRDLFDLLDWSSHYPPSQAIALHEGIYHLTLCSNPPESGILGDNQIINIYFQRLATFPMLAKEGIPTLCM